MDGEEVRRPALELRAEAQPRQHEFAHAMVAMVAAPTPAARALQALKTPAGLSALCVASGAAAAKLAQSTSASEGVLAGEVLATQTVLVSGAAVAAATLHGRIVYGVSRSNQNLQIWRAVALGAMLGVITVDAYAGASYGTYRLVPGAFASPEVVLALFALMAASLSSQEENPAAAHLSDTQTVLAQVFNIYNVASSLQSYTSTMMANWSRPRLGFDQIHAQWMALLRTPLGALGLVVAELALVATLIEPRSATQRMIRSHAPLAMVLGTSLAVGSLTGAMGFAQDDSSNTCGTLPGR